MEEDISPELLQQVLDSLSADERNALLAHMANISGEYRRTPMPQMMRGRQMDYTPSPLEYIASTLQQAVGGNREQELMQQMAQNLRQKSQGLGAFKQWGLQQPQQPGAAVSPTPTRYPPFIDNNDPYSIWK